MLATILTPENSNSYVVGRLTVLQDFLRSARRRTANDQTLEVLVGNGKYCKSQVPDLLVKLAQATVRIVNYQYCLAVQDEAVRSAAEDRDGAYVVATGGTSDLGRRIGTILPGQPGPWKRHKP